MKRYAIALISIATLVLAPNCFHKKGKKAAKKDKMTMSMPKTSPKPTKMNAPMKQPSKKDSTYPKPKKMANPRKY